MEDVIYNKTRISHWNSFCWHHGQNEYNRAASRRRFTKLVYVVLLYKSSEFCLKCVFFFQRCKSIFPLFSKLWRTMGSMYHSWKRIQASVSLFRAIFQNVNCNVTVYPLKNIEGIRRSIPISFTSYQVKSNRFRGLKYIVKKLLINWRRFTQSDVRSICVCKRIFI